MLSPSSRRRLPLGTISLRRPSISNTARGKAVLPKNRKRMLVGDKYRKRFCQSVIKQDLSFLVVKTALSVDITEIDIPREKSSYQHMHGFNSNPVGRESTTDISANEDIDSTSIFHQLNVLKRGGYWKHLPRNDSQALEWEMFSGEGQYWIRRKEENKENLPPSNHPNTRMPSVRPLEWVNEEDDSDEDYGEEVNMYGTNDDNPFVGSALVTSHSRNLRGQSIGFRLYAITQDGWMCGLERSPEDSTHDHQQQHLLLHLPRKVAALGRLGMYVRGIDLMKRRDNGALEPHTHHSRNIRDESHGDSLCGNIFL